MLILIAPSCFITVFPQTSVALGVLAVLLEESIPAAGPKSVRGSWPMWPPGSLPWPPAFKYQNSEFTI